MLRFAVGDEDQRGHRDSHQFFGWNVSRNFHLLRPSYIHLAWVATMILQDRLLVSGPGPTYDDRAMSVQTWRRTARPSDSRSRDGYSFVAIAAWVGDLPTMDGW